MATQGDANQARREAARSGISTVASTVASTVIEGIATGVIDIGAVTPVVAPLCIALKKAKEVVDGASRNQKELEELHERCGLITKHVIDKVKDTNSSTIDVAPLRGCVDDLTEMATRYQNRKRSARLTRLCKSSKDGEEIQRLRARIEAMVPIMGLSVGVTTDKRVANIESGMRQTMAPRPKLAPVPKKAPVTKSFHVVRDGVVDRVCEKLGGEKESAVAALMGKSGAGKTTTAAAMVGERGDRLRALFPDGVVWLRVGKGAGESDRLRRLLFKVAKRINEMVTCVDAPKVGEDGGSYVKKIVSQEKLKCLVVADDVWEKEVVESLRATGMWVLLTTRLPDMVAPEESVVIDTLTEMEAEDVLRGAAELPPGERLCDAANHVLKICGRVAMDTAFVGSWVCHVETKRKKDAWARAVKNIEAQGGGVGADRADNRHAVLRAGFEYLGTENVLAQKLYAELAVFPDGHAFEESDAAVLLGDGEVATKPMSILERWGVLKADASAKYRMHDAHMDFAREKLMGWEHVRKPAVGRWTEHISRLDFAVRVDLYSLLRMWRALERIDGDGWWVTRPYDNQLLQMDASDPSNIVAIQVVAELYRLDRKSHELEPIMGKVLEHCDVRTKDCLEVQGRIPECGEVARQLGEFDGPGFQLSRPSGGDCLLQTSRTLNTYGFCARAAGRLEDAEDYFRKALTALQAEGCTASHQAASAIFESGQCAQKAGRLKEVDVRDRQALEIKEAKLGAHDVEVAFTLHQLGRCVLDAGRPGEAEALFTRALEIEEARLGPDDVQVAYKLHQLGRCVLQAGRPGEAEALFTRALEIMEAKLGPDDAEVAYTLHELGGCVLQAGRPGEAEPLLRRELEIEEAKLGPDDVEVAYTLHELGVCVLQAGRPGEAEPLLRRALEIREANLGPDYVEVAYTLHELGVCVLQAGRPGEAEPLLRRALEIKEAKLGPDDVGVAYTLHGLGRCVLRAGRPGEAGPLLRRALEIREANLGPDDVEVAYTLHKLGVCVLQAGRPGEAEPLLRRALEIEEANLGPDDVGVAYTLHELGVCVLRAGRPGEAEPLLRRALEIKEAKLGPEDVEVAYTLHKLGRCVLQAGRPGEAEPLLRRALEIEEANLGPDDVGFD
ncbi:unnamed protein product [Scytosiphon promiscuus]